jgi:hypothetical protein
MISKIDVFLEWGSGGQIFYHEVEIQFVHEVKFVQ